MSNLWTLQTRDFLKGLVVAVLAGILTTFMQLVQSGVEMDLKAIATSALIAGCAYLLKNLSTDSEGRIGGKF